MATRTAKGPESDRTELEARRARELAEALARPEAARGKVQLRVEKKAVDVPERAIPLIAEVMARIAAGESVRGAGERAQGRPVLPSRSFTYHHRLEPTGSLLASCS